VVSESTTTEKTAQLLGLATRISKPRPEELLKSVNAGVADDSALFLTKTLRSGKRIEHDGNVVLMGDVNPGAEIVAEGNVIVWGRVRGLVHAGSKGDRQALICALDLTAAQIRIAEVALDSLHTQGEPVPQVAGINEEGKLNLTPWQPG
jgi:septum site-determining protein MinC